MDACLIWFYVLLCTFDYFKLALVNNDYTAQKMKFYIKDFFSKSDQIRSSLRIWSHFTEEIFNGKLHFLCSVNMGKGQFVKIFPIMKLMLPSYRNQSISYRSSRPKVFGKKGANFKKFTGKHLCQSLIFNKIISFLINTFFHRTTLVAGSSVSCINQLSGPYTTGLKWFNAV